MTPKPEPDTIMAAVLEAWPWSPLSGPLKLTHLQANAYELRHGSGALFVKVIPHGDPIGMNEIVVNQTLLTRDDLPVPRLILTTGVGDATLACWEWLEGGDLRTGSRHLLPEAFALLGRFHLARRHTGPVFSPTTHTAHGSIRELLDAERAVLCDGWNPDVKSACDPLFAMLEIGYPTLIHGDMHPGNLRLTERGLQFVDWGYARHSLNLFDLDYVRSVDLGDEGPSWWTIQPAEAPAVLSAYARTCGLPFAGVLQAHHAVMLWGELCGHYNAMRKGDRKGAAQARQKVNLLLHRG